MTDDANNDDNNGNCDIKNDSNTKYLVAFGLF